MDAGFLLALFGSSEVPWPIGPTASVVGVSRITADDLRKPT